MNDLEKRAVAELREMSGGDAEVDHERADEILLEVLNQYAPDVVAAWKDAREVVGFWYA